MPKTDFLITRLKWFLVSCFSDDRHAPPVKKSKDDDEEEEDLNEANYDEVKNFESFCGQWGSPKPGVRVAVAWSVARLLGMQTDLRTTPTFFSEGLVMQIFLRHFFLFRWFKKSSCQLVVKECTLRTGKLPPRGLSRNSVLRIIDRPDITSTVYHGRKATN